MSRPDRQRFRDRVDRKVHELRASDLSEKQLQLGVLATLEAGLPLRDAIVVREGRRFAEMATPRAQAAWSQALAGIRRSVPDSTMRLWIEPIDLIGEDNGLLVVAAPTGIRSWVERRYLTLIGEAVRQETDFGGASFGAITLPSIEPAVVA
jgi:DnaA N-terminal domain